MDLLPRPEVLRCFFDRQCEPHLSAMDLDWNSDATGTAERIWYFPGQLTIKGPPPHRFGVTVLRLADDAYAVRVLWNEQTLTWGKLRRTQIMTSALAPVLKALDTDLWYLLQQPVLGRALSYAA